MTTSPEMVVFTADQINQMRFFMDGVSLDAEHLALDVIEQVGPGGDFLTHDHTLRHFRNQWRPALYSRQRYDDWVATGARSAQDRLRDRTLALIEAHRPPELDGRIKQEIEAILRAG